MVSFIRKIKSDIDSANPFSFPQTIKFCKIRCYNRLEIVGSLFFIFKQEINRQTMWSVPLFLLSNGGGLLHLFINVCDIEVISHTLSAESSLIIDLCMVNYHYHCSQTKICVSVMTILFSVKIEGASVGYKWWLCWTDNHSQTRSKPAITLF